MADERRKKADEKACTDDFRSSLADLEVNSKPLINMLTMLADDNKIYAEKIVKIIETRLHEAPSKFKLPCLYLIDSIIKNVDKSREDDDNKIPVYQGLFGANIVSNFCDVFEKVNETTRMSMFKLRQTWNDLFDNKTLYALDVGVSRVDPAWPITAEPPPTDTPLSPSGTIHVNPKFLLKKQQEHLQGLHAREKREHSPSIETTARNQRRKLVDRSENNLRGDAYGSVGDDEDEMRDVKQMFEQKQQELEVIKQQLMRQEKEKQEREMKEQHEKNLQIERELRQQKDLQRLAAKQSSIAKVISTVRASAVVAPSSRDPRNRDSHETKTEQQTAIVLPTVAKPSAATRRAAPLNIFERFQNHPPSPIPSVATFTSVVSTGTTQTGGVASIRISPNSSASSQNDSINVESSLTSLTSETDSPPKSSRTAPAWTDNHKGLRLDTVAASASASSSNSTKSSRNNSASLSKTSGLNKSPRLSKYATKTPSKSFQSTGVNKDKTEAATKKRKDSTMSSEGINEGAKVTARGRGRVQKNAGGATSPRSKRSSTGSTGDKKEDVPAKKTRPSSTALSEELKNLFGDEDQDYRQPPTADGSSRADSAATACVSSPGQQDAWSPTYTANHINEFPHPAAAATGYPAEAASSLIQRGPLLPTPALLPEPKTHASPALLPLPVLDDSLQVQQAERLAQIQELRADLDAQRERLERPELRHSGIVADEPSHSPSRYKKRFEGDSLLPPPPQPPPIAFRPNRSAPALLPTPPLPTPLLLIPKTETTINRTSEQIVARHAPVCRTPPPSPMEFWVAPATPWYDNVQFYVPEHDPRWVLRARDFSTSGSLGSRSSDKYGIVIDGRPYEMIFNRPHRIPLGDVSIEVRLDFETRQLLIDDVASYRLGQDEVVLDVHGRRHAVSVRGPSCKLWIDGKLFELNVDSPAENINIGGREHKIRIDGNRTYIIVDGYDICPFGGKQRNVTLAFEVHTIQFEPPCKQILIDGDLCNLDLAGRYPAVIVGNTRRGIRFDGPPREIIVDNRPWSVPMDGAVKWRVEEGLKKSKPRLLAFGGPGHELIIDDQWYEVKFGGESKFVRIGGVMHKVELRGNAPEVKILGVMVPADELGRVTRGGSRPETGRGVGYNQRSTLLNNGPPVRPPPTYPVFRPEGPWGVRNPNPSPVAFGGGPPPPARPEFNPGGPMRTDDSFHHPLPSVMMPPPSMSYPPPMLPQYLPPPGPTVWNNTVQPHPNQPSLPPSTISTAAAVAATPAAPTTSVDVSQLLTQLLAAGIIQNNQDAAATSLPATSVETASTTSLKTEPKVAQEPCVAPPPTVLDDLSRTLMRLAGQSSADELVVEPVPDLTDYDIPSLRKRYNGVVASLHQGVPCTTCGMRFKSDELETVYKEHLDWHFKENKRSKEGGAASRTRGWYYEAIDWIQYEEVIDAEERDAAAALLEEGNPVEAPNDPVPLASMGADIDERPTASGDEQADTCAVCREAFEQFWDEEAEAWRLKDAVRYRGAAEGEEAEEGLVGRTYHRICFEDASKEAVDISLEEDEDRLMMCAGDSSKEEGDVSVDAADNGEFTTDVSKQSSLTTDAATEVVEPTPLNVNPELTSRHVQLFDEVVGVSAAVTQSSTDLEFAFDESNVKLEPGSTDNILDHALASQEPSVDTPRDISGEDCLSAVVPVQMNEETENTVSIMSAVDPSKEEPMLSTGEELTEEVSAVKEVDAGSLDDTVLHDELSNIVTDKDVTSEQNGDDGHHLDSSVEMIASSGDVNIVADSDALSSIDACLQPSGDASSSAVNESSSLEDNDNLSDLKQSENILTTTTTTSVVNPA